MNRLRKLTVGMAMMAVMLLASVRAMAQDPVVVISVRSVDGALGDVKYVLSAAGAPQLGDFVDGFIDTLTQGKGLAGLDRTKPLGAYLSLGAGGNPDFAFFIPVTDNQAFKGLATQIVATIAPGAPPKLQDLAGGMFSIQGGAGQPIYGKFSQGHCFLAILPTSLEKLPDPAKIASTQYDLSFDANLSKIPDDFKDLLLEQIEAAAALQREAQPKPPNEAAARGREFGEKMAMQAVRMLVKESERFGAGLEVDQKTKLVSLDFNLVAKPGSGLATALTSYGKTKSSFASLAGPDSAASMLFAMPLSAEIRQLAQEAIKAGRTEGHADIDKNDKLSTQDRKAAHELLDRLIKVADASFEAGQVDAAWTLNTTDDKKAQIVAAIKIARGSDLAGVVDEIVRLAANQPGIEKVKLDVAKHGGARIHSLDIDLKGDAKAALGDGSVHVGIRDDSVFFAIGGDSLAAVKSAIDKMGESRGNRPPVSVRVSVGKLISMFATGDDPNVAAARKAFAAGGDQISIELLPIERGARLRLESGDAVLRFIGLLAGQQFGLGQ